MCWFDLLLSLVLPIIKGNITRTKFPHVMGTRESFLKVMERQSDPVPPHSLPNADLASSFSDFFSEKITSIRLELDFDLCPCVFSVDFDARPRMITTVHLYFEHISSQGATNNQRSNKNLLFSGSS